MKTEKFISVKATAVHDHNIYHILISGESIDTDMAMYDAAGDGKYFLVMDGHHPVGIIFNEVEMDFKGLTMESVIKEIIGIDS